MLFLGVKTSKNFRALRAWSSKFPEISPKFSPAAQFERGVQSRVCYLIMWIIQVDICFWAEVDNFYPQAIQVDIFGEVDNLFETDILVKPIFYWNR